MKKISLHFAAIALIIGVVTSCNSNSEQSEKPNSTSEQQEHSEGHHEHHGEHHDRPEGAHHKGKGDRKGPPHGKHNPEQTKSLAEIGGYTFGDVAADFKLKNVDGNLFSLADIEDAKGYIVVFSCNECPFSKMYEDRLITLHNTYAPKGYPVVVINPNVKETGEKESFEAMQSRAKEKEFPFVYLADEEHTIYPQFGAVRTPHVFLLDSERKVQYIGAIDDNAKAPEDVKEKYLENAIHALENGTKPDPNFTKAIGCPVKAH